ncbi:hypothetical protein BD626DRAFT_390578 [Schizophyllum amplum]|uniref:C2H2-type domain-containing protein n=1 Tax=Schizophyllum amplum TaxID=97359 RepID=A0A550CZF3_9AGAR|nr:hypothetical protein BD626DRAFT_390578 [Auriculariopsis ampla]
MQPSRPVHRSNQRSHYGADPRHAGPRGQNVYSGYPSLSSGGHDDLIDNLGSRNQYVSYAGNPSQALPEPAQYAHAQYNSMRDFYGASMPSPIPAPTTYQTRPAYAASSTYADNRFSMPAGLAIPDSPTSAMDIPSFDANPYAPASPEEFLPSYMSPASPTTGGYYTDSSSYAYPSPSHLESSHQPYGMPSAPLYYDSGSPSAFSSGSSSMAPSPEQRSSEARHPCPHCSRTFTRQHDRRRHIDSVHENHTVECSVCHRTFTRLDSCQRHTDSGNCTPAPRSVRKRT